MTRTCTVSVTVPARGCPPSRYRFSRTPPAEDYRPAETWRVRVLDVPDRLSDEDIRQAVQKLLNLGGGLSLPARFSELQEALRRFDLELHF